MADHTASTAQHGTLTAATVDTVTLDADNTSGRAQPCLLVENRGTTADIYFRFSVTGTAPSAPTVAGDDCYVVTPSSSISLDTGWDGDVIVKLISAGTPAYSVEVF